jgi:hypothetical protein
MLKYNIGGGDIMKRKDGGVRSDYDQELDRTILDLIMKKRYMTVGSIKTNLNKELYRKLGWITIKRHIDKLLENNEIEIFYETEGSVKKKIRVYKLKDR